jgi:hypothetical protein
VRGHAAAAGIRERVPHDPLQTQELSTSTSEQLIIVDVEGAIHVLLDVGLLDFVTAAQQRSHRIGTAFLRSDTPRAQASGGDPRYLWQSEPHDSQSQTALSVNVR